MGTMAVIVHGVVVSIHKIIPAQVVRLQVRMIVIDTCVQNSDFDAAPGDTYGLGSGRIYLGNTPGDLIGKDLCLAVRFDESYLRVLRQGLDSLRGQLCSHSRDDGVFVLHVAAMGLYKFRIGLVLEIDQNRDLLFILLCCTCRRCQGKHDQ